jgi:iron-sulfur cluster repair protein YtfE (RIC family)
MITHFLLGEHAVFYAQFDNLETHLPEAENLPQVKSMGGMLAAALASHAQLENDLLFTALDPHFGGSGPVAVMRAEHAQIEGSLDQIQAAGELDQAKRTLLNIITLARQHFAKEEQILFPMAQQILDDQTLFELGTQWAERRKVFSASS